MSKKETIFVHLPAYRDPELVPTIKSAFLIVLNLCAIIKVVRPILALSNASCTIFSLSLSNALVASSNNNILGFLINALAIYL